MKILIIIILICLAAYGYVFYTHNKVKVENVVQAATQKIDETATPTPTATPMPTSTALPTPPPIVKHLAPDGVYYALQRISVTTDDGISSVEAGTKVNLVEKKGDTLIVSSDGQNKFEVSLSQLTNDMDIAARLASTDAQQQALVKQQLIGKPLPQQGQNAQAVALQKSSLQQQLSDLKQKAVSIQAQIDNLNAQLQQLRTANERSRGKRAVESNGGDAWALSQQKSQLGRDLFLTNKQIAQLQQAILNFH